MDAMRTIRVAANETASSEHTLRYYERIRLIEGIDPAENGHCRYTEQDLGSIEFAKSCVI